MNSRRARPTPSFGNKRIHESQIRLADVHHNFRFRPFQILNVGFFDLKRQFAFINETGFAFGARHGYRLAALNFLSGLTRADDTGNAQFAGNNCRMASAAAFISTQWPRQSS